MKLILAIIQPSKLEAVKEALNKVEVFRLTIVDVQGFGRQKGHTEVYRGHELTVNLLRKVQLQIAVNEDFVEPTVNAIMEAGRTGPEGRIGDGKIFILPLEDCIRSRTAVVFARQFAKGKQHRFLLRIAGAPFDLVGQVIEPLRPGPDEIVVAL